MSGNISYKSTEKKKVFRMFIGLMHLLAVYALSGPVMDALMSVFKFDNFKRCIFNQFECFFLFPFHSLLLMYRFPCTIGFLYNLLYFLISLILFLPLFHRCLFICSIKKFKYTPFVLFNFFLEHPKM